MQDLYNTSLYYKYAGIDLCKLSLSTLQNLESMNLSLILMTMTSSGQVVVYSFRTIIIGFMFISQEQAIL